ncbi:MAG: hypothetical protein ACJAX5_002429 [Patiriisocius sp.]|jgi:hypothetical protein
MPEVLRAGVALKFIKPTIIVVSILIALGIGLMVTGYGGTLLFKAFSLYNQPEGTFDAAKAVAEPDYSQQKNWAALPDRHDPADLVPEGIQVKPQGEHPVDTFFIHPTGYLTSAHWTSPMEVDSGTEENTQWMMANQASAYNGASNIYAPRYREANIFAYLGSDERRSKLLDFAYQDVERAFRYFLDHQNDGRPFIVAAHSQGTHHAMKLLSDVIDDSDLHDRLVAAYIIGSVFVPLSPEWFSKLNHIKPCQSISDLGCIIHWDTMPAGTEPIERTAGSLCTNPLSWQVDEEFAGKQLNRGAVIPEGVFNSTIGKVPDVQTQQKFTSLPAPLPQHISAQCRKGTLFVERQKDNGFASVGSGLVDSYHELDYALFYMDIHLNARLRSETYLKLLKP